jgi:hypothetical protein
MKRMHRLAAWLKPEDVEPALRLLALEEVHGQYLRRGFPISSRSNAGLNAVFLTLWRTHLPIASLKRVA